MLILFDQNTAVPIRSYLVGHTVRTAHEQGWSELVNGELLRVAEDHGFDVLLTADQGFAYQQNLKGRKIAVVILGKGAMAIHQASRSTSRRSSGGRQTRNPRGNRNTSSVNRLAESSYPEIPDDARAHSHSWISPNSAIHFSM